jgi:hypothetical protein
MASAPTPKETGKLLLEIFRSRNARPNETLVLESLRAHFLTTGGQAADFQKGIDWLREKGYVEDGKRSGTFLITQAAFDVM